jgi:simple sugar transport system substrate-binding protein
MIRHLLTRLLPLLGSAALLFAAAGPVSAADKPVRVAFLYVDPVGDSGWSYQHDLARRELERVLGAKVKTTFVENIPATADAERVIRQLAASGNDMIFTTSFGYMEPTLRVAKLFPKVKFGHATGFKTAANMVNYESRFYEGAYLLGVLAGKLTKSNTLGFVGSFPIPEVIRNINAYTLGARSVNPRIKTKVIWVDTWYDPGKERQAAEALIAQGADVMCQNTDSPAIVQVAETRGVQACGWDSDMSKYGPKAQYAANTTNWADYYIGEVNKAIAGTWTGGRSTVWGLKEKMVVVTTPNKAVPADVVKLFEERRQAIIDGKLHPFTGPLKDNTGAVKVPAGTTLTHDQLRAINWYVEGIDGSIPK